MQSWIRTEAKGAQAIIFVIGLCMAFKIAYAIVVILVFALMGGPPVAARVPLNIPIISWDLILAIVPTVLLEEVFFRLPLVPIVWLTRSVKNTLVCAVLLSGGFGYLHGSVPNIFTQGVGGFVYCVLFLKCGGMDMRILKPLTITFVTHLGYDAMLLGLAYKLGMTHV
jgi:membrane protease YdiL (CAAX protease family)